MNVPFDEIVIRAAEMKVVVVDELGWNFDMGDIARQTAVVPPIGLKGVGTPSAMRVLSTERTTKFLPSLRKPVMSQSNGVKPPSCSQTFWVCDPDEGAIVGGADVEEGAGVGVGGVLEVLFVPDRAFVIEEGRALGVPVAGDFECGCVGEVVVLGVARGIEGDIEEEAVFAEILMEVVKPGGVLIDDDVPVAIKGGGGAVVDVNEKSGVGLRGVGLGLKRYGGRGDEKDCGEHAEGSLQH